MQLPLKWILSKLIFIVKNEMGNNRNNFRLQRSIASAFTWIIHPNLCMCRTNISLQGWNIIKHRCRGSFLKSENIAQNYCFRSGLTPGWYRQPIRSPHWIRLTATIFLSSLSAPVAGLVAQYTSLINALSLCSFAKWTFWINEQVFSLMRCQWVIV